ncbi:thioredoxin-like protein [Aspergillus insuetus]
MPVTNITSLNEYNNLIKGNAPVILDFTSDWNSPSKIIYPVFESLSKKEEYGTFKFAKVDCDAQPDIAEENQVKAYPTFAAYSKGNKVQELVGASPQKLENLVKGLKTLE